MKKLTNFFGGNKMKAAILSAVLAFPITGALAADPIQLNNSYVAAKGSKTVDPSQFKNRSDGKYFIGFANMFSSNSWAVQLTKDAEWQADQLSEVTKFVVTDANFNANKQINDVQDMLTKGIDALVINPVSPTALIPIVEQALEKGVVVVVVSADLDSEKVTVKILADNIGYGRDGGELLAKYLKRGDKVIGLRGAPGVPLEEQRWIGAMAALNEAGIEMVGDVYTNWAYEKGRQACESLLLKHPDVKGVWSSGGATAQACIEVFKELGKPLGPITGEANNGFLRTWLEEKGNGLKSIAPVYPSTMAAEGLKAAVAILNGQADIPARIMAVVPSITEEMLDEKYVPELNDSFWPPANMPMSELKKLYGNK